jgi:AcrR family transcriptional regulator
MQELREALVPLRREMRRISSARGMAKTGPGRNEISVKGGTMPAQRSEKKQLIIDTAKEMFIQNGFQSTHIGQSVRKAEYCAGHGVPVLRQQA